LKFDTQTAWKEVDRKTDRRGRKGGRESRIEELPDGSD
jgi:hypothetical protein